MNVKNNNFLLFNDEIKLCNISEISTKLLTIKVSNKLNGNTDSAQPTAAPKKRKKAAAVAATATALPTSLPTTATTTVPNTLAPQQQIPFSNLTDKTNQPNMQPIVQHNQAQNSVVEKSSDILSVNYGKLLSEFKQLGVFFMSQPSLPSSGARLMLDINLPERKHAHLINEFPNTALSIKVEPKLFRVSVEPNNENKAKLLDKRFDLIDLAVNKPNELLPNSNLRQSGDAKSAKSGGGTHSNTLAKLRQAFRICTALGSGANGRCGGNEADDDDSIKRIQRILEASASKDENNQAMEPEDGAAGEPRSVIV